MILPKIVPKPEISSCSVTNFAHKSNICLSVRSAVLCRPKPILNWFTGPEKSNSNHVNKWKTFFETFWVNSSGGFEGLFFHFVSSLSSFSLPSSLHPVSLLHLVFLLHVSVCLSLFLSVSLSVSLSPCVVVCCGIVLCVVLWVWCCVCRGLARRKNLRVVRVVPVHTGTFWIYTRTFVGRTHGGEVRRVTVSSANHETAHVELSRASERFTERNPWILPIFSPFYLEGHNHTRKKHKTHKTHKTHNTTQHNTTHTHQHILTNPPTHPTPLPSPLLALANANEHVHARVFVYVCVHAYVYV